MNARADAIAQLEVAGDEVGVHVGEKHVADRATERVGVGEVLIDVTLRIDHGGDAPHLIDNQVGGVRKTPEVVLLEDYASEPLGCGTMRM
jgi:hypothetical protein